MHKMVHCTTISTPYNATQKGLRVRNSVQVFRCNCQNMAAIDCMRVYSNSLLVLAYTYQLL